MDKGQEMAKTSAVGSFQLFVGRLISTIVLAVGTIVLGMFIQESDLGLYTIALVPATTLLLFQDWGVTTALTRFCAKFRASNNQVEQRKIIYAGLIFEITMGFVLMVISILFATSIASFIGKPESAFLIVVSSVTILMAAIGNAPGGIFTGFEQMKLITYVSICLSVVQGVFAPLLVYLGFGALGAVLAFTMSTVVGAVVSLALLYVCIIRKLPPSTLRRSEVFEALKPLLKYGVPLAIGTILSGLGSQFYAFVMAKYVGEAMIGNNKIASNFTILLPLLTIPIITVLFPLFSKIDPGKEKNLLKTVYASSVKYTALIVVPVTFALIVLAQPLIGTLYGTKWAFAPYLLSLTVLYNLLVLFGWRSFPGLLQAVGETKLIMYLNLLSLVLSIPIAYLLVPAFGIVGIVIGLPLSAFPRTFIGLYLTWKRYGVKADFKSSAKILLAAMLASLVVYGFVTYVTASNVVHLVGGAAILVVLYLILAPIVGAVKQTDIDSLRSMFSTLGFVSKILEFPLQLMEKTLKLFRREKSKSS